MAQSNELEITGSELTQKVSPMSLQFLSLHRFGLQEGNRESNVEKKEKKKGGGGGIISAQKREGDC